MGLKFSKKILDYFLRKMPGPYYGVLAGVIGLICDILALILYLDYDFRTQMVSELALGPGGLFFTLGLIVPGILTILYISYLSRLLKVIKIEDKLRKPTIVVSIMASIAMIFIGVFPSIPGNFTLILLHGISTFISWIGGFLSIFLFSYILLKKNFPKSLVIYSFMTAGVFMFYFFSVILLNFIYPPLEWSVHLCIKPWLIVNAGYMIHKKIHKLNIN